MRRIIHRGLLLAALLIAVGVNLVLTHKQAPIGSSYRWLQSHSAASGIDSIVPERMKHLVEEESYGYQSRFLGQTRWTSAVSLKGQPLGGLYEIQSRTGSMPCVTRIAYGFPFTTRTQDSVYEYYASICFVTQNPQTTWRPSFIHEVSSQPFWAPPENTYHATGLVLNTAFFTSAIYPIMLIVGQSCVFLFGLRRRRRRRLGLCQKCAYDIHGLDRCPECGTGRVLQL